MVKGALGRKKFFSVAMLFMCFVNVMNYSVECVETIYRGCMLVASVELLIPRNQRLLICVCLANRARITVVD